MAKRKGQSQSAPANKIRNTDEELNTAVELVKAIVIAEPAQVEPAQRKIWNESNHPLGLLILATMFHSQ
jgi:hypothetical protein